MSSQPFGPVQVRVLSRALRGESGYVIPSGYRERRAMRRLTERGFLVRLGFLDTWKLTPKGWSDSPGMSTTVI